MKPIELSEFISLLSDGYTVVDARKSKIFSEGFIADSISIPWNENFINLFQELVGTEENILLIAEEGDVPAISSSFKNAGISSIYGYPKNQFDVSAVPSKSVDMLITIDAEELRIDYRFDEFFLIDVRANDEFETEHFEHAENIALNDLEQFIIELDVAKSYYVYAATTADAVTAGSLFKRNGFGLLKVVADSFENIKDSGIPIIKAGKNEKPSAKFSNN